MVLYPMDLEEFYWATGNDTAPAQTRQVYGMNQAMGNAVHQKWMRELRLYMLVGGMPQAVDAYLSANQLQEVDRVKRQIIELYDTDFNKIDPSGRASKMFKNIPAQLSSNSSRYMIETALGEKKPGNIDTVVYEMGESMVVNLAHHVNDPNVGLGLNSSLNTYKMYMADTGLFIDFLLSRGNKIVPIEVKSSGYKTHKSLDTFCEKFSSRIGERILLYTKDYAQDSQTTCIPVYYTALL